MSKPVFIPWSAVEVGDHIQAHYERGDMQVINTGKVQEIQRYGKWRTYLTGEGLTLFSAKVDETVKVKVMLTKKHIRATEVSLF